MFESSVILGNSIIFLDILDTILRLFEQDHRNLPASTNRKFLSIKASLLRYNNCIKIHVIVDVIAREVLLA